MNAHELVNVGESALVLYRGDRQAIGDDESLTDPLTVNIHQSVDKVIIYQQAGEDEDDGMVYVADFLGFDEAEEADGFRARFANARKVGAADANWFSFSGRSDTAPFHIQPNP